MRGVGLPCGPSLLIWARSIRPSYALPSPQYGAQNEGLVRRDRIRYPTQAKMQNNRTDASGGPHALCESLAVPAERRDFENIVILPSPPLSSRGSPGTKAIGSGAGGTTREPAHEGAMNREGGTGEGGRDTSDKSQICSTRRWVAVPHPSTAQSVGFFSRMDIPRKKILFRPRLDKQSFST